jgi:putative oxidoreductase
MLMPLIATDNERWRLLVRLIVGLVVFFPEGIQKLAFPAVLGAGRFVKIGIPFPAAMGPFVGIVEITCGALIIVGLLTRLAAVPLIITMIVALVSTKLPIFLGHDVGPFHLSDIKRLGFWSAQHEARNEGAVERPRSSTTQDQRQQQARPAQVGGPCIGIDENLDHGGHAEQGEGGGAREESEHQQDREEMLGIGRRVGGNLGWHERQRIFDAKQLIGAVSDVEQAVDLSAAGLEEDGRYAEPGNKQQQGVGHSCGQALNGESAAGEGLLHQIVPCNDVCWEPSLAPSVARQALGDSEPLPLGVLIAVQVPALTSFHALP